MGTEIGIKGQDIDPRMGERIKAIVCERDRSQSGAEIFVDGGIRRHTVPMLATAGADGVIPGSLVFADKDPSAADRKSTRLNSSHQIISYAVFCLKKKNHIL